MDKAIDVIEIAHSLAVLNPIALVHEEYCLYYFNSVCTSKFFEGKMDVFNASIEL